MLYPMKHELQSNKPHKKYPFGFVFRVNHVQASLVMLRTVVSVSVQVSRSMHNMNAKRLPISQPDVDMNAVLEEV